MKKVLMLSRAPVSIWKAKQKVLHIYVCILEVAGVQTWWFVTVVCIDVLSSCKLNTLLELSSLLTSQEPQLSSEEKSLIPLNPAFDSLIQRFTQKVVIPEVELAYFLSSVAQESVKTRR